MECRYYTKLKDGAVECQLCPHHCRIVNGKTGVCRSRRNEDGVLVSEVYGKESLVRWRLILLRRNRFTIFILVLSVSPSPVQAVTSDV